MKHLSNLVLVLLCLGCSPSELFEVESRHDLWLVHEGAELPIVIEGNTNSKVFFILLHGGPGSSAQEFNAGSKPFSDVLEKDYAVVYYDQRNAGLARGEWDVEKLTIEQHVEDLDLVIDLIQHKFGSDVKIFLGGHSWGGYLGAAYLLDNERQARVKAWININGNTHRNLRNKHNLERIIEIADQQIAANVNLDNWSAIREEAAQELAKDLLYNTETESTPNSLLAKAGNYIDQDGLVESNSSSPFSSSYKDNYDPLLILVNGRKGTLIEQMYAFDLVLENTLSTIDLPVLCVYGKYDVVTALQQGEYVIDNISTLEEDKRMVVLNQSGHSSMKNEPIELAEEIRRWIEKYK